MDYICLGLRILGSQGAIGVYRVGIYQVGTAHRAPLRAMGHYEVCMGLRRVAGQDNFEDFRGAGSRLLGIDHFMVWGLGGAGFCLTTLFRDTWAAIGTAGPTANTPRFLSSHHTSMSCE